MWPKEGGIFLRRSRLKKVGEGKKSLIKRGKERDFASEGIALRKIKRGFATWLLDDWGNSSKSAH